MLYCVPAKKRNIVRVERRENALFLYLECGLQRLTPVCDGILRVQFTEKESFSEGEKPGILALSPFSDWTYEEKADAVILRTKGLSLSIDRESNRFCYYNAEGELLLAEREGRSKELLEIPTYRMADTATEKAFVDTPDGRKEVVRDAARVQTGTAYHTRLHLTFGDEALYGLGQHEEGYGSLRGKRIYLHQANRKIAVPLLVSTKGYGILLNTYAPAIFNDTEEGSYLYTETDPEMDFFFINGASSMDGVIRGYRFLTGKAAMLPKWAYGYWQSQERYETQEEILGVAKEYRDRGIGLDCIVLDWCSWPDGQWGQKSFDPERFPDPDFMTKTLHAEHVHFMISVWPNLTEGTENYAEFQRAGMLLPGINNYNPFAQEGREIYWQQAERGLFCHGVDAWWCDNSEPFTPEWNVAVRPESAKSYEEYCKTASWHLPQDQINAYGFYHAKALYEGQRGYYERLRESREGASEKGTGEGAPIKEKRVVNLTRSGYLGQQRFGTVLWSGDISASFDTLRRQIAAGLNFCASGLPYWTVDIGAFFVKNGLQWFWDGEYDETTKDPAYCELFTRWYQWGAFLPVFRGHGTDCRRELWEFDRPEAPFYQALLLANRTRYELMPYLYSLAGQVTLQDESFMKPLAFAFSKDAETWEIKDQYLLGNELMICPVTEGYYFGKGEKRSGKCVRKVYLPMGCGWYDYWTERYYEGGQWILADAPLEHIPVFVKAGSIVPKTAFAPSVEEQTGEVLIQIYDGGDARFLLYEDAGDGYGYEKGEYQATALCWLSKEQKLLENGEATSTKSIRVVRPL
ncbi:MAG: DUF4968 domain-containing protein [Lachnospiraceae bacterium]|nr:DUF4968 domain-containing protein [Lachnospiraceae bacterium]